MSDFAPWLTKSFEEEFPNARQLKCFFHLKQNVQKNYRGHFKELEGYLDLLGSSTSSSTLQPLWNIIKKDLKKRVEFKEVYEEFTSYFEAQYMNQKNICFYIGASPPGFSNTNNMLEGHHRYLKREIFDYEVHDMRKLNFYL